MSKLIKTPIIKTGGSYEIAKGKVKQTRKTNEVTKTREDK